MTKSLTPWVAGLACALGGAVAGNAVGSSQPLERSTMAMMYQTHETTRADPGIGRRPPDHYPLVTRQGTVPVAELSTRGLYSQRRYQAVLQAADYSGPGLAPWDEPSGKAAMPAETSDAAVRIPLPEPAAEPLELTAGPASVDAV